MKGAPEDEEAHEADPGQWRRDPEQRKAHRGTVPQRAALDSREDADRDAADQPQHGSAEGKAERSRRAKDDLALHRRVAVVGVAESRPSVLITSGERLRVITEFDVERPVEVKAVANLDELLVRG